MDSFWWKGPLIVVFAVNAALTANPVRVELADQANTYLMWVYKADLKQRQAVYMNRENVTNKFQVVLPGSGDLSVLAF